MKDRVSMIFVQYGQIDVQDGAFVVIDQNGVRMHIPVGSIACIMLEPGTRISHAAVHLASTAGTPVALAPIDCSIRPSLRWMMISASRWYGRCTRSVLESPPQSGVVSSS